MCIQVYICIWKSEIKAGIALATMVPAISSWHIAGISGPWTLRDTSGKVYLRMGITLHTQWGVRKKAWEKEQLCRDQGQRWTMGKRCSGCDSRDSPASCGEDQGEVGCSPVCGSPRGSRYPPAAHGVSHNVVSGCALKETELMQSLHWSRLLSGTMAQTEESKQEKVF